MGIWRGLFVSRRSRYCLFYVVGWYSWNNVCIKFHWTFNIFTKIISYKDSPHFHYNFRWITDRKVFQQSSTNQRIIVRSLKTSFEQYMSSQYPLRQPFMRGISRIKGFLTELPHPTCPYHPQTYLCTLFIHHFCPIFYIWDFHTSFDTRFWAALWTFEGSASSSCIPIETASSHEYQGFLFGSCLTFHRR